MTQIATLFKPIASALIRGSGSERDIWKEWARVRRDALRYLRPIYRGVRVVWPSPGYSRTVPFEITGPAADEVLIRTIVSGVSLGTERANFTYAPNARIGFPHFPGYSLVGEVLKVGSGVKGVAHGQLVAARAPHASIAAVRASRVLPLPHDVLPEEGAFIALGVIAMNGILRGELRPSERVAVFGRGSIGQLAVQLAHVLGAGEVYSIAPSRRHQHSVLGRFAHSVIATDNECEDILPTVQADVSYEASGHPSAIRDALRATRDGGRVVLLGSPRGDTRNFDFSELADRDITILGAHISTLPHEASDARYDFRRLSESFLGLIAEKRLDIRSLISVEVNPWESGLFYRSLSEGATNWLGAVMRWDSLEDSYRLRHVAYWTRPNLESAKQEKMTPMLLDKSVAEADPSISTFDKNNRRRAKIPNSQPVLRVAVVGCGEHGNGAISQVLQADHSALAMVMDVNENLARNAGERYNTPWTTDYETVLSDENVDVVSIFTPHHLHAEQAIKAARAGKHIIVAKPLAHDLESAARIVRAAREANVQLSTRLASRYSPAVVSAKRLIDAGATGTILGVNISYQRYKPAYYFENGLSDVNTSWRSRWATAGGGVLVMNAIHNLDWLTYLTGMKVREVSAHYATLSSDIEVEDSIVMWLTLENGALATVNASTCVPGFPDGHSLTEWRLWGTEGHISLSKPYQYYSSRMVDGRPPERWHTLELPTNVRDPYTEYLDRFCKAVLEEKTPEITGQDGLRLQTIIDAAYRSSREHRPVRLEHPEL